MSVTVRAVRAGVLAFGIFLVVVGAVVAFDPTIKDPLLFLKFMLPGIAAINIAAIKE